MIVQPTDKQKVIIGRIFAEVRDAEARLGLVCSAIVAGQMDVPDGTPVNVLSDGSLSVEVKESTDVVS